MRRGALYSFSAEAGARLDRPLDLDRDPPLHGQREDEELAVVLDERSCQIFSLSLSLLIIYTVLLCLCSLCGERVPLSSHVYMAFY